MESGASTLHRLSKGVNIAIAFNKHWRILLLIDKNMKKQENKEKRNVEWNKKHPQLYILQKPLLKILKIDLIHKKNSTFEEMVVVFYLRPVPVHFFLNGTKFSNIHCFKILLQILGLIFYWIYRNSFVWPKVFRYNRWICKPWGKAMYISFWFWTFKVYSAKTQMDK